MSILKKLAKKSYYILIIYSFIKLNLKQFYRNVFALGVVVTAMVNVILKFIFFNRRPDIPERKFNEMIKEGSISSVDLNFPSGHLQLLFFICVFMFNIGLTVAECFGFLFFLVISLYYIIKDYYHSNLAVIVGSVIGSIIGYIFYEFTKN
jgi:hypothetical protein